MGDVEGDAAAAAEVVGAVEDDGEAGAPDPPAGAVQAATRAARTTTDRRAVGCMVAFLVVGRSGGTRGTRWWFPDDSRRAGSAGLELHGRTTRATAVGP
jgi:hypothetical protein